MYVCDNQSSRSRTQVLALPLQRLVGGSGWGLVRLTWRAEEAHGIIGAVLARPLLPVEAPEALKGVAMDHLASAACGYPVGGPSL